MDFSPNGRFSKNNSFKKASSAFKFSRFTYLSMTLTEAQRLAFLKGREKRMANIEKAKLEKAELEAFAKEAPLPAPAPEKPKVKRTRKPKTTPVSVEVKIDPDPSEATTEPETDPDEVVASSETPSKSASNPVSDTSSTAFYEFDQDAFANKIVDMLVQKGFAAPTPAVQDAPVKPKKPKARKPVAKKTASVVPQPESSNSTSNPNPFMWM